MFSLFRYVVLMFVYFMRWARSPGYEKTFIKIKINRGSTHKYSFSVHDHRHLLILANDFECNMHLLVQS